MGGMSESKKLPAFRVALNKNDTISPADGRIDARENHG